jgi:hypothetical protein
MVGEMVLNICTAKEPTVAHAVKDLVGDEEYASIVEKVVPGYTNYPFMVGNNKLLKIILRLIAYFNFALAH